MDNELENKEIFEMLCLALSQTSQGLVLMQVDKSNEQIQWAERIQERLNDQGVSIYNLSKEEHIKCFEAYDIIQWVRSRPESKIFIICNLQAEREICDVKAYIQRLNFARDQLLALKKVLVFGVSPYFASLLTLNASDLNSCFTHRCHLKRGNLNDTASLDWEVDGIDKEQFAGDVRMLINRFEEYHQKTLIPQQGISIDLLVTALEAWIEARPYLKSGTEQWADAVSTQLADRLTEYVHDEKVALKILDVLAESYLELAVYEKSIAYYQEALEIAEKMLGTQKLPIVANIYNNMGGVYQKQGKYEEALEYCQKALKIREETLGGEQLLIAQNYSNMSAIYSKRGEYAKALECGQKALNISEKMLGTEQPFMASIYNNMAVFYIDLGEYEKALEYCKKALVISEKILGREHLITAGVFNNFARVYREQGEYGKALEYCQKALKIREKVLGMEHPVTATSYNNMAILYREQGEPGKASEYLRKIKKTYRIKRIR